MTTVVLLSSSPHRLFARSPTPASSSPPYPPSTSSLLEPDVEGHKRFKTTGAVRDGFPGGFSRAKDILKIKAGEENLPLKPRNGKDNGRDVKTSRTDVQRNRTNAVNNIIDKESTLARPRSVPAGLGGSHANSCSQHVEGNIKSNSNPEDGSTTITITAADVRRKPKVVQHKISEPLLLDKASLRRRDWTPPPNGLIDLDTPDPGPALLQRSLSGGLMDSFGYGDMIQASSVKARDEDKGPTKRQKLDFVERGSKSPNAPRRVASTRSKDGREKRVKSAKRYTTITGLATSHYFGEEDRRQPTPMLLYLNATQNRLNDDSDSASKPPADTAKRKRAAKKSKKAKKAPPETVLLSPESAMKTFDTQDLLFGSASQLARDESPTFIRDTVQALNQSVDNVLSDPISTQNTYPSTMGSNTPRASRGTTRFSKSRSLWSAAGRDEDNALLQVDTIDLFDTPDVRLAFAGKDVLVAPVGPGGRDSAFHEKPSTSLRGGHRLDTCQSKTGWLDIDDVGLASPKMTEPPAVTAMGMQQARGLHTSGRSSSPKRTFAHTPPCQTVEANVPNEAARKAKPAPKKQEQKTVGPTLAPTKPLFNGFTTSALAKRLSAYGFKPVKKREDMIHLLDRCWREKQRPESRLVVNSTTASTALGGYQNAQDADVAALSHGDILSDVHGLASRPMPKVKKPKGRPKKATGEESGKVPTKTSALETVAEPKSPKRRKKSGPQASKATDATTKTPNRRKTKSNPLSEEYVVDIDDIKDLVSVVQLKASSPSPNTITAPHTDIDTPISSLDLIAATPGTKEMLPSASAPHSINSESSAINMQDQIWLAITTYKPCPTRNHLREPTWHEKILMYDPIVLEDLALWLNTEGLGRINEDREVSALEVREWCESLGLCCLWKRGWRGNAIKASTRDE